MAERTAELQIRIVSTESPSTTLLLGMQKTSSHHYFMDYAESSLAPVKN